MIVKEGDIELYIPNMHLTRSADVFYNPDMEFSRTLTIELLKHVFNRKKICVCDAFSASGVRGIRILKEIDNVDFVLFVDKNPKAVKLIRKNIEKNDIDTNKYYIINDDVRKIFFEYPSTFDYVDIDPFGSPANFFDNLFLSLKKHAFIGITATDTASISGCKPHKCFKMYSIKACKTVFFKEMGIRNLITFSNLRSFKFDYCCKPICFDFAHYFRVFLKTSHSGSSIRRFIRNISYILYCNNCGNISTIVKEKCEICNKKMHILFPVWLDTIMDKDLLHSICKSTQNVEIIMYIKKLLNELDIPFYFDTHFIARFIKRNTPKLFDIIKSLQDLGFHAGKTIFSPVSIKTNSPAKELYRIVTSFP